MSNLNSNKKRPYIDFYSENKISPVSQDISDLKSHFTRREALYRHLGIVPSLLKEKKILEIAPGSGYNAIYTLSCKPIMYTLIEGNPVGAKETEKRLAHFAPIFSPNTKITIKKILLEDFSSEEKFDVVLCEGMLSTQINPEQMLRQIMSYAISSATSGGGLIVITCMCPISYLSDSIRRLMGQAISNPNNSSPVEQSRELIPFFEQHFKNLSGMNRPIEDWILDNVLQPFYGKLLSIADAIDAVKDIADVYGASPSFITDWRWYKDIGNADFGINNLVIEKWWENVHNFIDYEFVTSPVDVETNKQLYAKAGLFFNTVISFQEHREEDKLFECIERLNQIVEFLQTNQIATKETQIRFEDAVSALKSIANGNKNPDCGKFVHMFGRGQQYLSFIVR